MWKIFISASFLSIDQLYLSENRDTTGILDFIPYIHIPGMRLNGLGKTLISMSLLLNYHPKLLQDHQA